MAVRDDFAAGEVLSAADLNDTFAEKLPYSYGTATPSTSDDGFLWYDSNSTPPDVKFWDGAAFQALTSGKILQIVRATDGTDRSTTSTSFVDVTGMSVTITPQKSDSAVIIIMKVIALLSVSTTSNRRGEFQITDSSNNAISGAEVGDIGIASLGSTMGINQGLLAIGYATPATTSAVTYKVRFKVNDTNVTLTFDNDVETGQMYAIEVAA